MDIVQAVERKRDLSFDFIKGILIFLVVWGHSIASFSDDQQWNNSIFLMIYSFHMPLFIMISGYFAVNTLNSGFKNTFERRTKRILIPALIWSLIYLAIKVAENHNFVSKMIIESIRDTWFLYCLYFLYLGAAIIWPSKHRYILAILIAIFLYVFFPYWPKGLKHFVYYLQLTKQWPMFILGIFIADKKILHRKYTLNTKIILSTLSCIYAFYVFEGVILKNPEWLIDDDNNYIWRGIVSLCSSIVLFAFFRYIYNYLKMVKLSNVMITLGNSTLGIYVTHALLLKIIPYSMYSNFEMFLIAIPVTTISYFITTIIRKEQYTKHILIGE